MSFLLYLPVEPRKHYSVTIIGKYFFLKNKAVRLYGRKIYCFLRIPLGGADETPATNAYMKRVKRFHFLYFICKPFSCSFSYYIGETDLSFTLIPRLICVYIVLIFQKLTGLPLNSCHFWKYCLTKVRRFFKIHIIKCLSENAWSWIYFRLLIVQWTATLHVTALH